MKKLLFLVVFAGIGFQLSAQETRFGVKAGATFSKWAVEVGGEKEEDYKNRVGFQFGFLADVPVGNAISFQPQINFTSKGSAEEHDGHLDKIVVNAIDIPLNLVFRSSSFFAGIGPNLGINLSASVKEEGESEEITIGNDPGNLKRMDFGANVMVGLEFKNGLFISAQYTPGFVNLSPDNGVTARSNFAGISLGYFF
jgi:hypothetical protein